MIVQKSVPHTDRSREALRLYAACVSDPFPFLLTSNGEYTLVGSNPHRVLFAKGNHLTEWQAGVKRESQGDPFPTLRQILREPSGLAVGYLGYDLAHHIERLPYVASDDRGLPDMFLAFYDNILRIDKASGEVARMESRDRAPAMSREQYEQFISHAPTAIPSESRTFTRERYLAAIERVQEYIRAGDVYQVNLSQRFHAHTALPPIEIYRRLSELSPAPWSACLEFGPYALVSSSPELFLDVHNRQVATRPIKGTRPRGRSPEEDERLRAELLSSEKDNAELAMIVDLERNDLGRVCEYGSVNVTAPLTLETHPTVHHLVATVEGKLRPNVDTVDLLRATFPSGSVTGAPKIRAMEIIDELEPTRRAAYTGAIGWIGGDGSLSLCVAIRIIEVRGHDAWFQVGGGIVIDSDPAHEYEETLTKGAAMAKTLGVSLQ